MEAKKKTKGNIHDENFKHNFTNKKVAHDFLKNNLPKKVLEKADIKTVRIEPNELLPSKYRGKRNADIIYSLKDKKGKKLYTLLHLEAQSRHEEHMALRIWEYHVAIARAHLRNGHKQIPLILTFVLYHGKEEWTSAKSIAELFYNFDLYIEVSLKAPFLLNLTKTQTDQLKKQKAAAAPQMIMKGKAEGDYCHLLAEIYPLMKKYGQNDEENIEYMAALDAHGEHEFLEKLTTFDPLTASNYKTMFEAAIQRESKKALKLGKQEGIQLGKQEGIQLGEKRGIQLGKQEGIQLGEKRGKKEGKQSTLLELVKKGLISQEVADKMLLES